MTLDLLFPHFDTLIRTPEDVARLNEAILALAVRGQLVPQDPADEPASELLKRIRAEKRRLIEDGVLVDTKPLPPISNKSLPFEVPKNWKWARLADIADVIMGQSPPGDSYNSNGEGVPLINGPVEFSQGPFGETQRTKFTTAPAKMCKSGDLLICVRGSTTGRTNIAAFDACIGRGVAAIRAYFYQTYLNYYVLAQRRQIYDLGTGSTFPSVSQDRIRELLVPFPPLAEQRRIVAKVESLFAQTRALEAKLRQAQADIVTVNRAALHRLSAAADDAARTSAWRTVADAFDLLYDDPRNVAELRQVILQLAVQGQLVPQDPADEPASELLKRIRAEKRRLVKERVLNDAKPSLPLGLPELPYTLPESWVWSRLEEAGVINPRNDVDDDLTASFIPMALINDGVGSGHTAQEAIWREIKKGFTHFAEGDVGIAKITPCFQNRKSTVFRGLANGIGAGTTELHIFRPLAGTVLPEYVLAFVQTPQFIENGKASMTGTAGQQRVPRSYVEEAPFPLPPLAEQRRIVAKVDQLMRLCDALEAGLARAQEARRALAAAVLGGAAA